MKICVVGHFDKPPDEGVRKIAFILAEELSKQHEVTTINVKDFNSWRKICKFHPDIIHFVLCPTSSGIAMAKLLSLIYSKARTVLSAVQPGIIPRIKLMSLFKPSLTLVQSYESEAMFQSLGYKTCFLPNGVDLVKFTPASEKEKKELRQKYGIDNNKFVLLNIASLKCERDLNLLEKLHFNDNVILIIGRRSERKERSLCARLRRKGFLLWLDYFPRIEEIFRLADCYVFPAFEEGSRIELPLSVLEAMACNLPVITSKFGALPRLFEEGEGLIFAENEEDFIESVRKIKERSKEVRTREKVLPYSWENILSKLEGIYQKLCNENEK
jgi:glycosyltransferase involved in cell wall biosynthesis